MSNNVIDKEVFKNRVKEVVKTLYRTTLKEATKQQLFQAVSYVTKDTIVDNWLATQKQIEEDDPKMLYYMSMEFLMGRALGNSLINLTAYKDVKEASGQRRSWPSGSLLPGFAGYPGLCCLWLRYPLPLRHVQTEN